MLSRMSVQVSDELSHGLGHCLLSAQLMLHLRQKVVSSLVAYSVSWSYPMEVWLHVGEPHVKHVWQVLKGRVSWNIVRFVNDIRYVKHLRMKGSSFAWHQSLS